MAGEVQGKFFRHPIVLRMSIFVVFLGIFWASSNYKVIDTYFRKENEPIVSNQNSGSNKEKFVPKIFDWKKSPIPNSKYFTDDELEYKDSSTIPYLVIIGHVFDVTAGSKHYGPGGGYHGFIGRDGSRAFITGKFDDEGLVSDLDGLQPSDFKGLANWLEFYIKTYPFVGYHHGRFFGKDGKPTKEFANFISMQKLAEDKQAEKDVINSIYPPCNVEWSEKAGTNVWCSNRSGGISRDWTGYPVLFKESDEKDPRCACVKESQFNDPRISHYPDCVKSHRCNGIA